MRNSNTRPGVMWRAMALSLPLAVAMAADPPAPADPRAAQAAMFARQAALPDTPGTGKFPAMKEEVASLPDHVVYRPAQLDKLGSTKLGLYIFGNGGCFNDGAPARLLLLEAPSHGYLALPRGPLRSGRGPPVPRPATPPPAPPAPAGAPATLPPPATKSADLI